MLALLLLAACTVSSAYLSVNDAGGTSLGCVVEEREPVAETDGANSDLGFAAADAYTPWLGAWSGTLTLPELDGLPAAEMEARMTVELVGPVEVATWSASGGDADWESLQAAEDACTPSYEVPLRLSFRAWSASGDTLAATVDATATVRSADGLGLWAALDPAEIHGGWEPATFDPAEMDDTILSFSAMTTEQGWVGQWDWNASSSGGDEDAEAVGVMEPLGAFALISRE